MNSFRNIEVREHLFSKVGEVKYNTTATLWSIDYDHPNKTKIETQGEFSIIHMAQKYNAKIFIVFCKVGELYFPIAKDAPILRIGSRTFAFGIPGFVFGLQFPPSCTDQRIINCVTTRFSTHAHYEDHYEDLTAYADPITQDEKEYWAATKLGTKMFLLDTLTNYGHDPNGSSLSKFIQPSKSNYTLTCLSKVTQAISISVMLGSLKPCHTKLYNVRLDQRGDFTRGAADPSISIFTNVLDGVELLRKIPCEIICATIKNADFISKKNLYFTTWKLSEQCFLHYVTVVQQVYEDYLDGSTNGASTSHTG